MSFRTMQLQGMTIGDIESDGDTATLKIDHAIIIKNMDDAEQDTKWYGHGVLTVSDLAVDCDEFPAFPARVATADIKDNQMTYRDEVVIPIHWHGNVGITLKFEGFDQPVRFVGEHMAFDVSGNEKYIEHIDK